jgi:hypothetical protein
MSDDSTRSKRADEIQSILAKHREREQELEHERRLARIRTESHALVWTGTTEELTDTIKRWFQAGWMQAENLEDALRKVALHFRQPDGTSVIKPTIHAEARIGPATTSDAPKKRLKSTIHSPVAARKMEAYLEEHGIGLTEFATKIGTTDRTLRSFRTTGKIKRSIFDDIATGMGVSRDALLKK